MSDFWLRKMATFFVRSDVDGDGILTKEDFERLADNLIKNGRLDERRGSALRESLVEEWETLFSPAAAGRPLTKEIFLGAMKELFGNQATYDLFISKFPIWFSAIDSNGNGVIDIQEFTSIYMLFGFNADQARFTFQAMDTDHDGVLSLEEYIHAGVDFITSEDESSPFKYFWGPLADI